MGSEMCIRDSINTLVFFTTFLFLNIILPLIFLFCNMPYAFSRKNILEPLEIDTLVFTSVIQLQQLVLPVWVPNGDVNGN